MKKLYCWLPVHPIFLLFISFMLSGASLNAQQVLRNPDVSYGELIKVIPSLKNYKAPPGFVPSVSRIGDRILGLEEENNEPIDRIQNNRPVAPDPVVQRAPVSPMAASVTTQNFAGMGYSSVTPADPTLCAGPNHVIQMINGTSGARMAIWNRSGVQVLTPRFLSTLVATPGYTGVGDPVAIYDQFADRYMVTEFGRVSSTAINTLIVFVSQTNDPTSGWYIYKFTDNTFFPDYPHWGVWQNVLYATTNDFNTAGTAYLGSSVWAINKAPMIAGNASTQLQRFRLSFDCAPVNISGPAAPSAAGTIGHFMYLNDNNYNPSPGAADSIGMLRFDPDFVTPANTTLTFVQALVTAPYKTNICGSRNCVPSLSGNGYDAVSDRVMNRVMYRNFGTYEAMVLNYTVDANAGTPNPVKAGIRWYELRKNGGSWSIYQQSTYAPDNNGRWMGSININSKGQIALGYNRSGSSSYASVCYTGRNATDALNTMTTAEIVARAGTAYGTASNRWGDYNDLPLDVVNDSLFWMTAMYGNTASQWATQIVQFKIGDCNVLSSDVSSNQGGISSIREAQNIIYTSTINNTGCTNISNYLLTDTLPANVSFVSATNGGTYNNSNRVVSWPVNITAGLSQVYSVTVSVNPGSYFTPVNLLNETVTGSSIPAGWAATIGSGTSNWVSSSANFQSASNSLFGVDNAAAATDFRVATTTQTALGNPAPVLTFWHNYNTETDWDGGVVEMSINNGSTWTDLGPNMTGNFYNGSVGTGNPIAGRAAFTGSSGGWIKTTIKSLPANQNALFRFRMTSDGNTAPAGGGWYVDDILLQRVAEVINRINYFDNGGSRILVKDSSALILPSLYPGTMCNGASTLMVSPLSGTTYQWQVDTGTGFANVVNDAVYSGATSNTLQLLNAPSSWYGYNYRCVVDAVNSTASILKFSTIWRGLVDNTWENPGNWDCGKLPDANTDVIINNFSGTITVNSNGFCRSLTLNPGAKMDVQPGFKLTVTH